MGCTIKYGTTKSKCYYTEKYAKKRFGNFYQGVCFSPTKKTFIQAIENGNFLGWPGLTKQLINNNYDITTHTLKGHINQERKNLQSTKFDIKQDYKPDSDVPNVKTHHIICSIIDFDKREIAYADLTASFPHMSSRGNQYLLVIYHYNSNAILVYPLKTRQAAELTKAYTTIYQRLKLSGNAPTTFVLDNESSNMLLDAFKKNNVKFQKVPPHQKRRNAAERAIQTWKTHFLAGLVLIPPGFPIGEWDRLIMQGELNLILLRNARANPKLSAWAYLLAIGISMPNPWHHQAQKLFFATNQKYDLRWICEDKLDITLPQHHITIDV